MPDRHCPKCVDIPMSERRLSDNMTKIDICPQCRGGWFDATELARSLSTAVEDLDVPKSAEKSERSCPKCKIHLMKFLYPETNIEIDVCKSCHGIWLDRGEFRGINELRAKYQDSEKMSKREIDKLPKPKTFKDAVVSFVDKVMIRLDLGES